MTVYMVFEPPERGGDPVARAQRIKFVPDRFSWSAFLLAPLWMLGHGLWLVLVAYVVVLGAVVAGLWAAGVGFGAGGLILALIALLAGFEAANMRRWTLLRRGWHERGMVIGDDLEAAERRFFDTYVAAAPERKEPSQGPPPLSFPSRPVASDVIGLFPQPGASR
jgi:uncharacterized protein DUF2628